MNFKSMIPPVGFLIFLAYIVFLLHVVGLAILYLMADF